MKSLYVCAVFLISGLTGHAQEDANWRYIRPSNTGLPGDYVTTISSDTCDNLWVGAYITFWEEGGVGEFDGQAWKNWTNFEGHLPAARVRDIFFDKENHVWIATQGGLVHYDRDTIWETWNTSNSILPDDDIYDIASDDQNNIWIVYNGGINGNGGLAKWDGTTWTVLSPTTSSLPTKNVFKLVIDDQGIVWIASAIGLIKHDGLNFIVHHTGNSGISGNVVGDLTFDENGLLWVLTSGGLNTFDGTTWNSHPIVAPGTDYSSLDVKNGQIAIGILASTAGVAHYDGSAWAFYPSSNHLYDVHFDNSGTLWVCGIGFIGKQISGSNWKVFRKYNSGLADYSQRDIFIDNQNRKWFASGNGGHSFFDDVVWRTFGLHNNGFEPYPFLTTSIGSATAQDTAGYIWMAVYANAEGIGRWNESLNTFDIIYNEANTGVWMLNINTLVIDSANRIWAGSNGYGIYMYDGNQWHTINQSNSMLVSDYINQLYVDQTGDVWAGTHSGVVKFSGGSLTGTLFSTSNSGIINDFVNEIVQQPNGIYWFGTGEGISKLNGQTWTSYTEADGIGGRVVDGLAWDETNQLLYVGAYEVYYWPYYGGLTVYDGTTWSTYLQDSSPIAHKQVEDIELDQFGNVWMVTQTMGITIYNPNGVVGLDDPDSDCPTWILTTLPEARFTNQIDVSGFPNPVTDYFSLAVDIKNKGDVKVQLFDVKGSLKQEVIEINLNPGNHDFIIPVKDFDKGIYLLRVTTIEGQNTIKLIKE
jgi:ligand-binding sensor domain-containing protein